MKNNLTKHLLIVMLIIAGSNLKSQTVTFFDEFNTDLSNWILYGDPSPVWVSSAFSKNGLFDNNGDPNYNSGAISSQTIDLSEGFILESEVYLDFSDLNGCWSTAGIGIADLTYQDWGGYNPSIYIELSAAGLACWATPADLQNHTYLSGGYPAESGYISFGELDGIHQINADSYSNGWHIMKIVIDNTLLPKFYIDNTIIFAGNTPIASSILSKTAKLWLGSRSSGSAGKCYHNWVKVSKPSQTGSYLYFSRYENSKYNIYRSSTDGTNLQQLTSTGNNYMPRVSPDKTKLVFISDKTSLKQIYTMNLDGTNVTQLTTSGVSGGQNNGYVGGACWTPDGKILYINGTKIYKMNTDGSNVITIATAPENYWSNVRCSSVGKIAAQTQGSWGYTLKTYIMNADGSSMTLLLPDDPGGQYMGNFSADGTKLYYNYDVSGHEESSGLGYDNQIYSINIDGTGKTRISNNKPSGYNDLEPFVSGSKVYFVFSQASNTGPACEIWRMNLDGSQRELVISGGEENNYPEVVEGTGCAVPAAAGSISGTNEVCPGQTSVAYSISTIADATSYNWFYSGTGAAISGTNNNITINFDNNASSGFLTVSGSNTCGNGASSAIFPINVNSLPAAAGKISGPTMVCQGQNSVSYSVDAITGASSYTWNYSGTGATIIGTTNNVAISFSSGATSGNLTVSGQNTCGRGTISASYPVNVNLLPMTAGVISGPNNVCQGQNNITYSTGVINGATSYTWVYSGTGEIISGNTKEVSINFLNDATSGDLMVYGSNSCGFGTRSAHFSINVTPKPAAAGTISGATMVCQGQNSVSYSVASIANASGYSWSYTGTGVSISDEKTKNISIDFGINATSGTLTVKGTNSCGDGTVSANYSIKVNPMPTAAVITQIGDTLRSSADNGNQWYLDGVPISGANGKQYIVSKNGYYHVIVTNQSGCQSLPSNTIHLLNVSLSDAKIARYFELYPNPNRGEFNLKIDIEKRSEFDIEIYNSLGKMIWNLENVFINDILTTNVKLENAPAGVYYVQLKNNNGSSLRRMLITK